MSNEQQYYFQQIQKVSPSSLTQIATEGDLAELYWSLINSGTLAISPRKTGIYIPTDWGQYIYPKLNAAQAGTDKAVIHCVGDSITQGFYSSDLIRRSWVGLMTSDVQNMYGDGGSGWMGVANSVPLVGTIGNWPSDNRWTLVGTWTLQNNTDQYNGPGYTAIFSAASLGTVQTATATVRGTKITIYYNQFSGGGTFTPIIDGVSQTAVSTNGSNLLASVSYTVAAGSHTLQLSIAANQGNVIFYGASGENSTGTVINRFGRSGGTSAMVTNAASTFGTSTNWTGGTAYPADLIIYSMFVNDASNSVAVDTYLGNVADYLRVVRDGNTVKNGKTDLIILWPALGHYEPSTPISWQYATKVKALCEHYGAAFIDIGPIYANSYAYGTAANYWSDGTSSGLTGTDAVHPGDVGHQALWNIIKPILKGIR